ncbi:hypothetical protein EH223_14365 [candidate division KSB1 bacterium]|nr:hypothetical protein [candidate division KSB1 bacterium]RQW01666.1 MAG: hypothetical protein EH223_14365 [candidate division KSB1 bacterium]
MNRFSALLKSIHDQLDVPQPAKSRILLEIAADLEDTYEFYRERGESEENATRLAQEKFILDDLTIAELSSIHQPLLRKWMDRISLNVQSRWERVLLILTLLTIAALSGRVLLSTDFMQNSIFVWPIWGTTIAGAVAFFIKFYKLYLVKDHQAKILRKGIDIVGYLGAFSLALGFTGYFYELLHYGVDTVYPGGSLITVITTVTDSPQRIIDITNCFIGSSTVMLASLFSTLFMALLWYILNNKATAIEMAEAETLLA